MKGRTVVYVELLITCRDGNGNEIKVRFLNLDGTTREEEEEN